MVLFKRSIGCQNWVAAPGSTSRAAAAVVKNPPWPGQHKYSEMSTHCAVCLRGLYEVSPELLERNLSDVAASLMLEDSCAFGVYFDFISEPHTDLLSLPPKIVFDDHGVQKQSFALSKLWANWICISVHIYVGLAGAFLLSLLLLHFVLHICLKRAMINELYLDLNRIMYILVHRHLDCIGHFESILLNYGAERCQWRWWVLARTDYIYLMVCVWPLLFYPCVLRLAPA